MENSQTTRSKYPGLLTKTIFMHSLRLMGGVLAIFFFVLGLGLWLNSSGSIDLLNQLLANTTANRETFELLRLTLAVVCGTLCFLNAIIAALAGTLIQRNMILLNEELIINDTNQTKSGLQSLSVNFKKVSMETFNQ